MDARKGTLSKAEEEHAKIVSLGCSSGGTFIRDSSDLFNSVLYY